MRRGLGYTLVEMMVVVILASTALGLLWQVFSGSSRLNQAATLAIAIQEALLVQETLGRDLKRLGMPPGATVPAIVTPESVVFYISQFKEGDPVIHLTPVRYTIRPTAAGNLRLMREVFNPGGKVEKRDVENVVLKTFSFNMITDPQGSGKFLVATGTALTEDMAITTFDPRIALRAFPVLYMGQIRDPPSLVAPLTESAGYVVDGPLPPPLTFQPDEGAPP